MCAWAKESTSEILISSLFIVAIFFQIRLEGACQLNNCSFISFLDGHIRSWSVFVGVWILWPAASEQSTWTVISIYVSVKSEAFRGNGNKVAH